MFKYILGLLFSFTLAMANGTNGKDIFTVVIDNKSKEPVKEGDIYNGEVYNHKIEPNESGVLINPSKLEVFSKEYGWHKFSLDDIKVCEKDAFFHNGCDIRYESLTANGSSSVRYLIYNKIRVEQGHSGKKFDIILNLYDVNNKDPQIGRVYFIVSGDVMYPELIGSDMGHFGYKDNEVYMKDEFSGYKSVFTLVSHSKNNGQKFKVNLLPINENDTSDISYGTYAISLNGYSKDSIIASGIYDCRIRGNPNDFNKSVIYGDYNFNLRNDCFIYDKVIVYIDVKKI
ncbi:hypothetical protein BZ13_497 [Francisella philomiragia subsp. philomiragia ATCC 25015]|uniref:hypothetical protein n=1 Tax=Francisella philomiragia TaxID=28110 RepID=UPI0001AF79C6|nr:hypothetical protein [Francisella philomiragia]AJI74986.1 hypothetical protein BZ13_497 [Francisella philomiragia subsp. philomiragia ATCC 25015]EET21250.1 predicted protein [Francisella philomiragia subsp. philomiragia ATCC 25015]MBK2238902.1 hypothetical protein [Francisella philomiragia]